MLPSYCSHRQNSELQETPISQKSSKKGSSEILPSRVRRERSGGMRRTVGAACGMSWKAPTHTSQHCYGVEMEPKPRHSGTGSPCCHRSEQPGDVCGTDQEALRHGCSHTTPPIPHCRRGAARSIPQGHGTAPAPSHSAWLQPVNLPSGWPGLRACSQVPRHTELPHQRAQPVPHGRDSQHSSLLRGGCGSSRVPGGCKLVLSGEANGWGNGSKAQAPGINQDTQRRH